MYTYKVANCEVLREMAQTDMERYDAYHHDHDDDVPEGIVLNVQPEAPDDEAYLTNLPF